MSAEIATNGLPMSDAPSQATIRPVELEAQVDVRADPADAGLLDRIAASLGVPLPAEPNTVAGDPDGRAVLWLGPDEWLVVDVDKPAAEIERAIHDAADDAFVTTVDVSENRVVLELRGPSAREILEAGCGIDLHPRVFRPGRCAQTLLARANVIVWQTSQEPAYRLFVRPSFAGYLARWLVDAMAGVEST
ncbi:MAG: sarcosine oxidase subunit gamma [Chloroflexota bacterium]